MKEIKAKSRFVRQALYTSVTLTKGWARSTALVKKMSLYCSIKSKMLQFFLIFSKAFLLSALLLNAGSCTRLETLHKITPTGTKFQIALTHYYYKFAEAEAKKYDWVDSQHFINKAYASSRGKVTYPEILALWHIPTTFRPEMGKARESLMKLLKDSYLIAVYPDLAAKAQFSFDCWVEEQEEVWQHNAIEGCRENFYQALHQLNSHHLKPVKPHSIVSHKVTKTKYAAKTIVSSQPKAKKQPAVQQTPVKKYYKITIDNNGLTQQQKKLLKTIASNIKSKKDYTINITSYYSNETSEKANISAAHKLAKIVKKILYLNGVSNNKIMIYAYGEHNPDLLPTDRSDEVANKVVEIILGN